MAEVTQRQILDALKSVMDPDRKADIVGLNMVSGIAIKGGHVAFAIQVDPERGPHLEPLRKEAEQAVYGIPGVLTVAAVLTAERTAATCGHDHSHDHDHGHHHHGHGHAAPGAGEALLPNVHAIVAVASGKGGVGKSTTAVNLSLALAGMGLKVGVFDADVFGPSMPRLLGIEGEPASADGRTVEPMEGHGVKCMSMGFLVPEDSPIVWRGPMVVGALQQLMRDVNWGELDVMIIDMPPGTGDTQLTMSQSVPLTGAVIVSTPQDIALLDARKGLNMFRKVDVPVLGIVENMSYHVCPNCGFESHIFGHGGAKVEAMRLGCDFLGEIPLDIEIRETSDIGEPIVVSVPDSPHAQAYRNIAAKVWDKVQVLKSAQKGPSIRFE